MSTKYLAYLLRAHSNLLLIIYGGGVVVTILATLLPSVAVSTLAQLFFSGMGYFAMLFPAFLFYRSLFGREALLIHQLPLKARTLLNTHIVLGLLLHFVYIVLHMLSSHGLLERMRRTWELETSEIPGFDSERLFGLIDQMIQFFWGNLPNVILLVLVALLTTLFSILFFYTIVTFVHRKRQSGNRILAGLGGGVLLGLIISLVAGFAYVGLISLYLNYNENWVRLTNEIEQQLIQGILPTTGVLADLFRVMLVLLVIIFSILSLIFYVYTRKSLEQRLHIV